MLEAQQISAPSAQAISTVPLSAAQLDVAWRQLVETVNMLKTPAIEPFRDALFKIYDAWDFLYWNTDRPDWTKPYDVKGDELRRQLDMFLAQKAVGEKLQSEYPKKAESTKATQGGTLPELLITAKPPSSWAGWLLPVFAGGVAFVLIKQRNRKK